jgi:hypothetical protein
MPVFYAGQITLGRFSVIPQNLGEGRDCMLGKAGRARGLGKQSGRTLVIVRLLVA